MITISPAPTLADLLAALEAHLDLAAVHRRDLVSAVRRIAEILGRPPEQLAAHPRALRPLLKAVSPAAHGIQPSTWKNLKCRLLAALRLVCGDSAPRRPLDPRWAEIFASLPTKQLRNGLSRLSHFCSDRAVAPGSVDDALMKDFLQHLETETLVENPEGRYRNACRLWNRAAETVPGWPAQRLSVPSFRAPGKRVPLAAFPASFQKELESYLAWRSTDDPFADADAPARPLRARTLALRHNQLHSAAAHQGGGRDVDGVTGLAVLVEAEAFKSLCRQVLAEQERKVSSYLEGLVLTLRVMARDWLRLPEAELATLRDLAGRLKRGAQGRPSGLTPKNRRRLQQFDDPATLARLIFLPDQLMAEACRGAADVRAAVQAQLAVTIALLLACPIRMNNLIALRWGEHLTEAAPGGRIFLTLEPSEVKNGALVDFELPEEVAQLLRLYRHRFLPLLDPAGSGFLFVAQGGLRKAQATLSQQLEETLWRRAGIRMTPHLFRHLAAKLALAARPGELEPVRQLLGHKHAKTTIAFYAEFATREAGRLHDATLARLRAELAAQAPRRRAAR